MDYKKYELIFSKYLSVDTNTFVKKILDNDFNRITTPFQPMGFKEKLQQNYYTSLPIEYGNALEEIFKEYLIEKGAIFLPRNYVSGKDCDQIFEYNGITVLIEQKIRDDHDSSKKRGQVDNYNYKKQSILNKNDKLYSCCWFIDDSFKKNKNYYLTELPNELFYGEEIEKFLFQVFGDNRCEGFYNFLLKVCNDFRNNFNGLDFNNLKIDYTEFTAAELLRLFKNEDAIKIFFDKKIDYNNIITYVSNLRNSTQKKELLAILGELNNGTKI